MGGQADERWAALCLFRIGRTEPWNSVRERVCGGRKNHGCDQRAGWISDRAVCCAGADAIQFGRWDGTPRATVFAEEFKGWRETTGVDFFAWRTDAADAAGLALHVLLLELVRDEPVFGKPRIHCAGGELSQRDWLWTSVPRSAGTRGAWRDGVSRRVGGWKISARARGCGRQANRIVGRELRGLSDRAGPWLELGHFRGRRGHAWSA